MSNGKTGQLSDEELLKGTKVSSGKAPDKPDAAKTLPPDDKTGVKKEPGKYDGKSDEELRQILADQEKVLGKMSERLDNFKGDTDYWRAKAEAMERERQLYGTPYNQPGTGYTQPHQSAQSDVDPNASFDWQRPVDSVSGVVDRRLQERDQVQMAIRAAQVIDEAKIAFGNGYENAVKANPKLFEGQDFQRKVVDYMYNYYAPYAQRGQAVAHYVGNPRVWVKVAQNMRLDAEEYDRLVPEHIEPVSSTGTEIPTQGKTYSDEPEAVNFEDGTRHLVDFFKRKGYVESEEEAADMVREERKERGKLEE